MEKANTVKKKKYRLSKPFIIFTVFIEFIISIIICTLLVFYSPFFTTVKKYIVSSAMESRTQQYIAKIFLSDDQINELLSSDEEIPIDAQDLSSVITSNVGDDNITRYNVSGAQFTGYIIRVDDPTRVKVGMTSKVGVVGEYTSTIAENNDAVAAINGGGFQGGPNWSDSAQNPTSFVFHDGQVVWQEKGFSDSDEVNTIGIDSKGNLIVGDHSIDDLKELNVLEAVTMPKNSSNDFRPIIVNGKGRFTKGSSEARAPRTAIAQLSDGAILLIVLDGRQVNQLGATYYELQELLTTKFNNGTEKVVTAAILDGGGSSTMYYKGEVINNPSAAFGERTVATAFYVE